MTPTLDRTSYSTLTSLIAQLALAAASFGQWPNIIYVDDDAPAGGDGSTWDTAFNDLQDALDKAEFDNPWNGWEIHVGHGVYRPDGGTGDRMSAFEFGRTAVSSSVNLDVTGGFAGYGSANPDLFDPAAFVSVVNGDLRDDDTPGFKNREDNSVQLLRIGPARYIRLNGLLFRGGNASETPGIGGVIEIEHPTSMGIGSASLGLCSIEDNQASPDGAVMSIRKTGADFSGCRIAENAGRTIVARLLTNPDYPGSMSFWNCVLSDNAGSTMIECDSNVWLANTYIIGNVASSMTPMIRSDLNAGISTCVVSGNSAEGTLIACNRLFSAQSATIFNNRTGGEIALAAAGRSIYVTQSIVWRNSVGDLGAFGLTGPGYTFVTESDVQGGRNAFAVKPDELLWGPGNLEADPMFRDPDGPDDDLDTPGDNDLRLNVGSPCIDTGNGGYRNYTLDGSPNRIDGDGDGEPERDIGPYEYNAGICAADWNQDGTVDAEDLWDFWNSFDYGYGDFNHDGFITGDDWDAFIIAYEAGC